MKEFPLIVIEWSFKYPTGPDCTVKPEADEYFRDHREEIAEFLRDLADRLERGVWPFPAKEAEEE